MAMHPRVAEYRSLPRAKDRQPDPALNQRKLKIIQALDEDANQEEVSTLLLELLRDPVEFDLVRAEAVEVVGLYIDESSPLWRELFEELLRIHADASEVLALKASVEPYVVFVEQTLGA